LKAIWRSLAKFDKYRNIALCKTLITNELVDVMSSSLNFLVEILDQAKALRACLSLPFNDLQQQADDTPSDQYPDDPIYGHSPFQKEDAKEGEVLQMMPRQSQAPSFGRISPEAEVNTPLKTGVSGDLIEFPAADLQAPNNDRPFEQFGICVEAGRVHQFSSQVGGGEHGALESPDIDQNCEQSNPNSKVPQVGENCVQTISIVSASLMSRYDRQKIYDMVWQMPLSHVAKLLGHTEHAMCNACSKLLIPTPPKGFWSRKHMSKDLALRPPLPEVQAANTFRSKNLRPGEPLTVSALIMSRYDRDELYEKVWQKPLNHLSREFNVSDETLATRCRNLHVPMPGPEYWQRKAAGLPIKERPPLAPVTVTGFTRNTRKLDETRDRKRAVPPPSASEDSN
jgi:hypothetical protein